MSAIGVGRVAGARQQALLDYTCNNNSANRNCTTKTTLCRRVVAISCQFSTPPLMTPNSLDMANTVPPCASPSLSH